MAVEVESMDEKVESMDEAPRSDSARSATTRRRPAKRLLVRLLLLAALGLFSTGAVARLYAEPLDVSGTTRLPRWLSTVKERDEIAYPAHVALGTLLNRLHGPPAAAGLQWVKAAAHARSPTEVERVVRGLATTRRRSESPDHLEQTLCSYVAQDRTRP